MKYYTIKSSSGKFYTTSQTPQDGFTRHDYEDRTTKEKKTNYIKELDWLSGVLKEVSIVDHKFMGETIGIKLYDVKEKEDLLLQIPIFSNKDSINDYAKSFITIYPNLKQNEEVSFTLEREKTNKRGYLYKTIFGIQDKKRAEWAIQREEVPAATKTKNKVTKKEEWDFSDVDAFYYEKINQIPKRTSNSAPEENEPVKNQKTAPAKVESNDDDEDLPF